MVKPTSLSAWKMFPRAQCVATLAADAALSANSPYDSWRAIHSRRWTTYGIPPPFRDAADYDGRRSALHGVGGTSDAGTLN
jgi:hypothetical protein